MTKTLKIRNSTTGTARFPSLLCLVFVLLSLTAHALEVQPERGFHRSGHAVYVIAHRGAHNGVPENSIPAYTRAIALGSDFIEIDVRATKDGHFVSIHNPTIKAYTEGRDGLVSDMTLSELMSLDIGRRIGPEWVNTKVPTFEQILALCKGKAGIYLDLKVPAVAELMKIIKRYGMEKDVIWYIPLDFYTQIGAQPFGNSFPMPDPGNAENLKTLLQHQNVAVVATDMGALTPEFIQIAHDNNVMVFVDEHEGSVAEWQKMLKWKVDGIQTDHPERLIKYLNSSQTQPMATSEKPPPAAIP
ncbi:glycerophosphodiester phosphodiesterase family protein [Microbulbifer sp. SAOS-129_SWC]|uniref:glycerophosphodiester phosphodiesterase n=1 Tax=Microbulbifer sp. SAOS-129_SWC TaxID=3145235 RepID=UPI0032162BDE